MTKNTPYYKKVLAFNPASRLLIFLLLCLTSALGFCAEKIVVEQWDVFEINLDGPSKGNPYLEVELSANFQQGDKNIEVSGFYDGNGKYKIRFMPEHPGEWRYKTFSNRWQLTNREGKFEVSPANGGNHGPVRVVNTFHFAYADGTPYKQIGTTSYTWTHRPAKIEEQTLKTLSNTFYIAV